MSSAREANLAAEPLRSGGSSEQAAMQECRQGSYFAVAPREGESFQASFVGEPTPPCCKSGGYIANVYLLSAMSLGVGVFAMPQVFNLCGWLLGTFLLILFAASSNLTGLLCVRSAEKLGVHTFEDLVLKALWHPGQLYYSVAMVLTTFIGNCAHIQTIVVLLGDVMIWFVTDTEKSSSGEWTLQPYKEALLMAGLLAVALPYCLTQSIKQLEWIGTFSVCMVSATCLLFVGYSIKLLGSGHRAEVPVPMAHFDLESNFRAAGAICFAYTSLLGLFPMYAAMEQGERYRAKRAVYGSSVVCFVIYFGTAFVGSVTFGDATGSNCLYNVLPGDMMPFRFAILGLVVCITLVYPIINFPMVLAVEAITGHNAYSRAIISVVGELLVIAVNMFVKDLVDLFGLCGSLGLGSIIYVIPCLVYLTTTDDSILKSPVKVAAALTLILGLLVTIVTTYFVFRHIITGK